MPAMMSESKPPHLPSTRTGSTLTSRPTLAMPMPLLVAAPMRPSVCVPCHELLGRVRSRAPSTSLGSDPVARIRRIGIAAVAVVGGREDARRIGADHVVAGQQVAARRSGWSKRTPVSRTATTMLAAARRDVPRLLGIDRRRRGVGASPVGAGRLQVPLADDRAAVGRADGRAGWRRTGRSAPRRCACARRRRRTRRRSRRRCAPRAAATSGRAPMTTCERSLIARPASSATPMRWPSALRLLRSAGSRPTAPASSAASSRRGT